MAEKLTIDNFAGIKHIELDVSKINILIGPQAVGKSICAKLLYLFKNFDAAIRDAVIEQKSKPELEKAFLDTFKQYFPSQNWHKSVFKIRYQIADNYIEISRAQESKIKLNLSYSQWFYNAFKKAKRRMKLVDKKTKEHSIYPSISQSLVNRFSELGYPAGFNQIFIPAGRSFFSTFHGSIFSFLSANKAFDPFLAEFGKMYELVKRVYSSPPQDPEFDSFPKKFLERANDILCGKYKLEKEKDYIITIDGRKISLINSSSGQQEILPLVLSLIVLSRVRFGFSRGITVYIEEPEAHIFPDAQKKIIELITSVYNEDKEGLQFFITTHSPYILTAFNNLIQAGSLEKNLSEEKKKDMYKVIPKEKVLDPDHVKAYSLSGGKCKCIIDKETSLIDANVIDDVSNDIAVEFGKLLELE